MCFTEWLIFSEPHAQRREGGHHLRSGAFDAVEPNG